jgi:hypothetical protein
VTFLLGVAGRDDEATSLARVLILSTESRHHLIYHRLYAHHLHAVVEVEGRERSQATHCSSVNTGHHGTHQQLALHGHGLHERCGAPPSVSGATRRDTGSGREQAVAHRSRRDKGGTELPWGEQVLSFSRQLEFLLLGLGGSNVPFTGSKIVGCR